MTAPTPYLHLPGTAREALTFYGEVFGSDVQLFTFAQFSRDDGPPDAIAHGQLSGGPVSLFASDVAGDEPPPQSQGLMLSLLGTAPAPDLRAWFSGLAEGGRVDSRSRDEHGLAVALVGRPPFQARDLFEAGIGQEPGEM